MTRFFSRCALLITMILSLGIILPPMASIDATSAGIQKKKKEKKKKESKSEQTSDSGSGLTRAEIDRLLEGHNRLRAQKGVPDLQWSEELAGYAQAWANRLGSNGCRLEHRPDEGEWKQIYGENISAGSPGSRSIDDALKGWESEKSRYRGEPISNDNFADVGHYTQMVWRNTTRLGCGKATCRTKTIIVCNYDPAGNMLGQKPW